MLIHKVDLHFILVRYIAPRYICYIAVRYKSQYILNKKRRQRDENFPADVTMRAFNPFIPHDALNSSIYVAVDTLEYLKKSGRVTPAAAAIGSVLNIKPVLQIQGGKLDAYKKVRGMKQATKAMFEGIKSDMETRFAGKDILIRAAYSGSEEVKTFCSKRGLIDFAETKIKNPIHKTPLTFSITENDIDIEIIAQWTKGKEKFEKSKEIIHGKAEIIKEGKDISILAIGKTVERAVQVSKMLEKEEVESIIEKINS